MDDQSIYGNRVHVRKDKTNPRRIALLTLFLFATAPSPGLLVAGMVLVILAVLLHGWAAGYLARAGYAEREKILTVRGPYRHNRNPYYLAQLMMDSGFFLLAGLPMLLIFYLPVIFTVYKRWVANEEKFLAQEFGEDYQLLMAEVPRWMFQFKPAPARGSMLNFKWSTYRINHELGRSLSHLTVMGGFVTIYFIGNPGAQIDSVFRMTILAIVAAWLLVRDVFPVEGVTKSLAWGGVAATIAVIASFLLSTMPVWNRWTGISAWIGLGGGLILCITAVGNALIERQSVSLRRRVKIITRPLCQWYVLALGVGLATSTLGGLWLGIAASLVVWALHLGGHMKVLSVQQCFEKFATAIVTGHRVR